MVFLFRAFSKYMRFHILTIFPNIFECYFKESILKRAKEKGLIDIKIYNLRDFTKDKHKSVDDKPYGGGPGMVLMVEPIFKAIKKIESEVISKKSKKSIILMSAKGRSFNQKIAEKFSKFDDLILICGRYEGVDERVAKYIADEEISIGDYILTGGEIPAIVVVDAVSRFIPNVLGNICSLEQKRFPDKVTSYPVYTRPSVFKPKEIWENCPLRFCKKGIWKVPEILLSGDHKKIEKWREKHSR